MWLKRFLTTYKSFTIDNYLTITAMNSLGFVPHADSLLCLVCHVSESLLGVLFDLGDVSGVLLDVVVVDPGSAHRLRVEQPDQDCQLQHIVEGDEVEDKARELVDHIEESEDDPVGQPLLIIFLTAAVLQSVERHEHGVRDAQECSENGLPDAKYDECYESAESILHDSRLLEACLL
jgi:hypothetical protein